MLHMKISVSKSAVKYFVDGKEKNSILYLLMECFPNLSFKWEDEEGRDENNINIEVSTGCYSLLLTSQDVPDLFNNTIAATELKERLVELLQLIRAWYEGLATSEVEFDFN